MLNIGTVKAFLELDGSGFRQELKDAKKDLEDFTSEAKGIDGKLQGLSGALTTIGGAITKGVTLPLAGLGAYSSSVAKNFEAGLSKVQAISGATAEDMELLKEKALEMGAKTKFSSTEAAEAFSYMAMAGWKTEDMLSGIEGIMSLAAASGEDLATTSDIVTDALTAFGLSAKDSGHFADVLAAASSNSNTNVAMMGETFKYAAAVAGSMGYEIDDVAVAIGLMANGGIKASQAGTSLRNIIQRMVKPTKDSQNAMDKLGLSIQDSEGNMKSFGQIMIDLRSAFGNVNISNQEFITGAEELNRQFEDGVITEKEYNKELEELTNRTFGAEEANKAFYAAQLAGAYGLSGLLNIVNASDEDFNKLTAAIQGSTDETTGYSAATEQAEIMMDNFQGSCDLLKSAIDNAAFAIGERINPYLRNMADYLQNLVSKFSELSPEQQDQIVKWGLIAAAVGPVIWIFGKAIGIIGSVIGAIKLVGSAFMSLGGIMTFLTGPIGITVLAIGALVAAFIHFWNTSEDFRDFWIDLWNKVKTKFSDTKKAMEKVAEDLGKKFADFRHKVDEVVQDVIRFFTVAMPKGFEDTKKLIAEKINAIRDFFIVTIPEAIEGFVTFADEQLSKFVSFFTETIPTAWDTFTNETLPNAINAMITWFQELPDKILYFIGQCIGYVYLFGVEFGENVTQLISDGVTAIITFFSELPGNIWKFITSVIESVVQWGSDMKQQSEETGKKFLENIVMFFSQLPGKVWNFITRVWNDVKQWATNMREKALEMARNFLNNVVTFFSQLPGKVYNFITNTYNKVVSWSAQMVFKAYEMAKTFLENIVTFFKELPGNVKAFIDSTFEKVKAWYKEMTEKAAQTARDFVENIIKFFRELPGKVKQKFDETIQRVKDWASDLIKRGNDAGRDFVDETTGKIDSMKEEFKSVGKKVMSKLKDGMESKMGEIKDSVGRFVDSVKEKLGKVIQGFKDVVSNANKAKEAARSVDGSHAGGLSYVPFNGYIAELHEGERVLTKKENAVYSRGTSSGGGSGDTFVFYNTKPDPYEYARQMKRAKQSILSMT